MSVSAVIMMVLSLTLIFGGVVVCSAFAFFRKPTGNNSQTKSETIRHE